MFNKVDQADFLAGEHEVLRFWREQEIFRKLQEQNRGRPKWSFLDGPITANNPMGVHHAWGRTYKDAYQRYYAMTGHELRYQNGFDCQGLWVEVEVEKELNLGSKRDIENLVRERPGQLRVFRPALEGRACLAQPLAGGFEFSLGTGEVREGASAFILRSRVIQRFSRFSDRCKGFIEGALQAIRFLLQSFNESAYFSGFSNLLFTPLDWREDGTIRCDDRVDLDDLNTLPPSQELLPIGVVLILESLPFAQRIVSEAA
jgi:hypothetical protein